MTAILALAFALRAIMAVRTSVMFEDGPHFLAVAKLFANGDWAEALSHPYHPLYSGLIAAFELLIHDWDVAALSVSVIGGTAAVLALYLFLRDAFDSRSAICGALIVVVIFSILRRQNFDRPQTQSRTRVWVAVGSSLLVGWLLLWPGGLREFASVLVSTLRPEVSILVALGIYASISASSQRESQPRDVFIAAIQAFYAVVLLGLLANYSYLGRPPCPAIDSSAVGIRGSGSGLAGGSRGRCRQPRR